MQLKSVDVANMTPVKRQKIYNLIFKCISTFVYSLNQLLKLDQNLYISNMVLINKERLMGDQKLISLDEF
jgi:hypothetical protein